MVNYQTMNPAMQIWKIVSGQEYKHIMYKSLSNGIDTIFQAFLFTAVLAYMMEMPMAVLILALVPFFIPACVL
jgi:hypothetical protein